MILSNNVFGAGDGHPVCMRARGREGEGGRESFGAGKPTRGGEFGGSG